MSGLEFVLGNINRFAAPAQLERLRFLAKGIPAFGHVTCNGDEDVYEIKRRIAAEFPNEKAVVAILKHLLSVAKFDAQNVSRLDPFCSGYDDIVPDVSYHEVLVKVSMALSSSDFQSFLGHFSQTKIGTVHSNIRSPLHLFERLIEEAILRPNDPHTLTEILEPLQQSRRTDLAEYVRQCIGGRTKVIHCDLEVPVPIRVDREQPPPDDKDTTDNTNETDAMLSRALIEPTPNDLDTQKQRRKKVAKKKKCTALSCFLALFFAFAAIACLGLTVRYGLATDLSQPYEMYGEDVTIWLFGHSIDARSFDKIDVELTFEEHYKDIQNVTLCSLNCSDGLPISTQHKGSSFTHNAAKLNRFYAKFADTLNCYASSIYLLKDSVWHFTFQNQSEMADNATLSVFNDPEECRKFIHNSEETNLSKRVFYESFFPMDLHASTFISDEGTYCAVWTVPNGIVFYYETNLTVQYYDYDKLSTQCVRTYDLTSGDNNCDSLIGSECKLSFDTVPNRKPVLFTPDKVCLVVNQGENYKSLSLRATVKVTAFKTFSNYQFVFSTFFLGISFIIFSVCFFVGAALVIWFLSHRKDDFAI